MSQLQEFLEMCWFYVCKSDYRIRSFVCVRFEFSLIFIDVFAISGGMGKCHNYNNSLKCVGFMCKNDNRILCVFMFDSIFLRFLLLYLRFWTDWKNGPRPRPAAQATQRQQPAQAPSLSAGIPGGNWVETGWKLGTKMRMSDPWPRPVPAGPLND